MVLVLLTCPRTASTADGRGFCYPPTLFLLFQNRVGAEESPTTGRGAAGAGASSPSSSISKNTYLSVGSGCGGATPGTKSVPSTRYLFQLPGKYFDAQVQQPQRLTPRTDETDHRFPVRDLAGEIDQSAGTLVAGREPCSLHRVDVSWVRSALYRSCTAPQNGRLRSR